MPTVYNNTPIYVGEGKSATGILVNGESLFSFYLGSNLDNIINNLDTSNLLSTRNMFYANYFLESIPLFDTSNVINFDYMFFRCRYLRNIPLFNTSKALSLRGFLHSCENITEVPLLDTSNATNTIEMLRGTSIRECPAFNLPNVKAMHAMFMDCIYLEKVGAIDVSNVPYTLPFDIGYSNPKPFYLMFAGCTNLKSILMYGMKSDFDISASTRFEREDLVIILNNLALTINHPILTMGSTNLAKLTEEDKAIATNKGWRLA